MNTLKLNPLSVNQTNHFYDLGYGWLCKHCSAEDAESKHHPNKQADQSAPGKESPLAALPLARWTDGTRRALRCPRCGIEEMVSKA